MSHVSFGIKYFLQQFEISEFEQLIYHIITLLIIYVIQYTVHWLASNSFHRVFQTLIRMYHMSCNCVILLLGII